MEEYWNYDFTTHLSTIPLFHFEANTKASTKPQITVKLHKSRNQKSGADIKLRENIFPMPECFGSGHTTIARSQNHVDQLVPGLIKG